MKGQRRKGRECALQILYQIEMHQNAQNEEPGLSKATRGEISEAIESFFEHFEAPTQVVEHASSLVKGILLNIKKIDETITQASPRWRIERMAVVDRNVLRIASYEMLCSKELSAAIVMDEGIEIAKRFGSERSASFVNGILDAILKSRKADKAK